MNTQFGSGVLYAVPVSGNLPVNPSPFRPGVLQEVQLDIKGDLKKLYGQKQMPVATARGKIDVTVKSKLVALDPNLINQLFFACSASAGISLIADSEQGIVGAGAAAARANSHAYIVGDLYSSGGYVYRCVTAGESAAAPPVLLTDTGSENADGTAVFECVGATGNTIVADNVATFVRDYGVVYGSGPKAGQQLINSGAVAPNAGQYQCNGGTYTFAAGDAGVTMLLSYLYTVANRGTTIELANNLMGYAPEFRSFLYNTFRGKYFGIELNKCTASAVSIPTKQEDFWISDLSFDACADASDVLGYIYADNV